MSEIVIRFDLRLGAGWRRVGRLLLVAAMMFAVVPELASESVTLTTYYPAPMGVYTSMITTNNTFLARDASTNGGQVSIGSSNSGTGQQLDVYSYKGAAGNAAIRATYPNGGGLAGTEFGALAHRAGFWSAIYANQGSASYAAYFNGSTLINNGGIWGNYGLTPGYQNWAAYGTGSGGAAIYNSNQGGYQALMIVGNNTSGSRRVAVWDKLWVHGSEVIGDNGARDGSGTTASYVSAAWVNGASPCYFSTYPAGAATVVCAAGYYATQQTGYMSKYINMNDPLNAAGDLLCCRCPAVTDWPWGSNGNGCPNL